MIILPWLQLGKGKFPGVHSEHLSLMTFSLHNRHFPDVLSHNVALTDPSASHVSLHAILEKVTVKHMYFLNNCLDFGISLSYIILNLTVAIRIFIKSSLTRSALVTLKVCLASTHST